MQGTPVMLLFLILFVMVIIFLFDSNWICHSIFFHYLDHDRKRAHNWMVSSDGNLLLWDSGLSFNHGNLFLFLISFSV